MLPSPGETPPPILKHLISVAIRETERAKDGDRKSKGGKQEAFIV